MLKKKNIVITGAAGLLGREHCLAVMEEGANVILVDKNLKGISEFSKKLNKNRKFQGKSFYFKCDISKEVNVKNLLNFLKKNNITPHILINNAAYNPDMKKNKRTIKNNFDLKFWEEDLSVNLTGAFLCSKIIGHEMAKNKKGNIINISSDLGVIAPDQRLYNNRKIYYTKPISYSVTKHGIIGLTKYLATYWAKEGIRCNCLIPGGVENNQNKKFLNKINKLIPVGRMAKVDEYKGAIKFLCSDASSYMNGSNLVIDGGRTIW
jgi:NAD(P)-dependent dehydrogenase (short-subunit alcohol dehydrogenase family)